MFMEQDQEQTRLMGLHWGFFKTKILNKPFTISGNGNQRNLYM